MCDNGGNYVEDIDDTSTKLAGVLGVTSEEIKDVLVKGKESNKAKKDPKTEHLAKTRKRSDA